MKTEDTVFRMGWIHGNEGTGAQTPGDAETLLMKAGLPSDYSHVQLYLNGWDDGIAGDTFRLASLPRP